jgi:hypothetical protein
MIGDPERQAVERFFDSVEHIDLEEKAVHTRDGCLYSFSTVRETYGVRWTVVKLGERSFMPFCVDQFLAKSSPRH